MWFLNSIWVSPKTMSHHLLGATLNKEPVNREVILLRKIFGMNNDKNDKDRNDDDAF